MIPDPGAVITDPRAVIPDPRPFKAFDPPSHIPRYNPVTKPKQLLPDTCLGDMVVPMYTMMAAP